MGNGIGMPDSVAAGGIPGCCPEIIQISVGGFDDNFAYVIHDSVSGDTAVLDPCGDGRKIGEILQRFPGCRQTYILVTHDHHDHLSALEAVQSFFPAPLVALSSSLQADIVPEHGQKLSFGAGEILVLHTPGHSADSVCYYLKQQPCLFSGDTLFVDDIGFCDGPQMYQSLRQCILPLPEHTLIYPGHDYGHLPVDTLQNIRKNNPFLAASSCDLESFLKQLQNLA